MRIIKLIKINKKIKTSKKILNNYVICVVKKSSHKNKVYEKLGSITKTGKLFKINIFRLCYWLSKEVAISGNSFYVLQKNGIFSCFYYHTINIKSKHA